MRTHLLRIAVVAGLAALEAIRQPISLLLLTTMALAAVILPLVTSHTLGESERMMADTTLALHLFIGMLLGGFTACHSLTGEIRRGTAATVLSKPVSRAAFYLGKFVGLALVLLSFSLAATACSLIATRAVAEPYAVDWRALGPLLVGLIGAYAGAGAMNFFTRRPFVSDAYRLVVIASLAAFLIAGCFDRDGQWQAFGAGYLWPLATASLLVALAIGLLAALSLALAARFDVVPTVTICGTVLLLGMMSDYLFGRQAATSPLAAALYAVLPNWQHFWMADALHQGDAIPLRYVAEVAVYAAAYLLGLLGLGMFAFSHTEVKA